ncbi:hypothetical protein DICPUDRAFT_148637 [Dictyostelium purpureum]|uniref:Uncharacterized protein n=1 Tax=Dictyostelium purpureum TaxID=5786 RepID=F0ZBM1_DICPU|nr:uncharacterized protein DICPUDRAFT_148637 [Dictyostelium purpureum]EGC38645.1 hypothetical protein DICPUDRAFT_148637 [Dictyostelium purpureum]|eukprot:XP_003284838.1 hypothetical protein DICPUDRAFT_148637 [Dictyostelium purpureum]
MENTGYQLLTFNQNDMKGNKSFYGVVMDPIKNFTKLMENLQFGNDGFAFGTLELTFDARSGGGQVYYSCANVRLQNKPYNFTGGRTIEIQATLTLTDVNGDKLGSIETDGTPGELFIPDLVVRQDQTQNPFKSTIDANAGLINPTPIRACNATSIKGCQKTSPCHNTATDGEMVNQIYIGEDYDVAIYQLNAMLTKTEQSTYTLQYFPSNSKDVGIQLLTFNQKNFKEDNMSIRVVMDAIKNNPKYKKIEFDKNGFSFGIVELTFDARENPKEDDLKTDRVFYSCARVRLQKKPVPKAKGTTFIVDSSVLLRNTEEGIGNATPDYQPYNMTIPRLVEHNADDSGSGSQLGNKDPNGDLKTNNGEEEEKQHNGSNSLVSPFAFITLLSLICTLLKL